MIATADIGMWLAGLPGMTAHFPAPVLSGDGRFVVGSDLAISFNGYEPPDISEQLIIVTLSGGAGALLERTYDSVAVQLMIRGAQNDHAGAERLTGAVDDAVMGVVPPVAIGVSHCNQIDYSGGPPRWLVEDSAHRDHFTANYLFTVARTVF